jgi:glycosyltransferase involved in cell wall biosynthesis
LIPITAILPVRNAASWLPKTFTSVLANLETEDELIVIDDGSTDSSLEIINRLAANRDIKVLKGNRKGLVQALNLGLENASHDWIARFDADDFYPSERIKRQRMQITHGLGAIFCDYEILINGKKSLGIIASPVFDFATRISLLRSQRTAHPSVLFDKSLAVKVGGYREQDFPAEDLSLWLRISNFGRLESVPFLGLKYNLNNTSISSTRYGEAKVRSLELVKNALDSDFLFDFNIDEVVSTLENYNIVTLGKQRRLLHIYDLLNKEFFDRRTTKDKRFIIKLALHEISRPSSSIVGSQLFISKIRRQIARNR